MEVEVEVEEAALLLPPPPEVPLVPPPLPLLLEVEEEEEEELPAAPPFLAPKPPPPMSPLPSSTGKRPSQMLPLFTVEGGLTSSVSMPPSLPPTAAPAPAVAAATVSIRRAMKAGVRLGCITVRGDSWYLPPFLPAVLPFLPPAPAKGAPGAVASGSAALSLKSLSGGMTWAAKKDRRVGVKRCRMSCMRGDMEVGSVLNAACLCAAVRAEEGCATPPPPPLPPAPAPAPAAAASAAAEEEEEEEEEEDTAAPLEEGADPPPALPPTPPSDALPAEVPLGLSEL